MERSQMDKILKEQAFQSSGNCDQSECAVEIGKLLSVDRMIVGSVGRIGDLYTVQARILDVQTGEIVFSANQDHEGKIEGLLSKALPLLARRLADAVKPPPNPVAEVPPSATGKPAVASPAPQASLPAKSVGVPPSVQNPSTAKTATKIDPGTGDRKRSGTKTWLRRGTGIGAIATGIVALAFRREALDQRDKADKAVSGYNSATSDFQTYKDANAQAVKKANTAMTKSIITGGVAGLLATGFALTYAF